MPTDSNPHALLAHLGGARPPAPIWFKDAIAVEPERVMTIVQGAAIETLAWGERGRPGILLLHGNASLADMWRFIAPQLLPEYRVAALSWSGMGGSDWRAEYSLEQYCAEALHVAELHGLFDSPAKPVIIAHSAGGGPAVLAAHHHGDRLGGVAVVDSAIRSPDRAKPWPKARPRKIYPTFEAALARFRFAPEQPCTNLHIADFIARASLRAVEGGWTWRFDPQLLGNFKLYRAWEGLAHPRCPLAIVTGAQSLIATPDTLDPIMARVPVGTPHIVMADAYHHVMVDQPLEFVRIVRGLAAGWR